MPEDQPRIPPSVLGVTAPILAEAYTHSELDALFPRAGFPGDPPPGNKVDKCLGWLRRANNECPYPLERFGRLIAHFMDQSPPDSWLETEQEPDESWTGPRERIRGALADEGLSYQSGGVILGSMLTGPSRSLQERLAAEGIEALEREYRRAYENIESDPGAAVTAGCAILEAACKAYLESVDQPLPSTQSLKPLWNAATRHLGLNPQAVANSDLRRIQSGMLSVVDGVASLRTHEGSAHGRSPSFTYTLEPRHARLAVHAAHTLAHYLMEVWQRRQG